MVLRYWPLDFTILYRQASHRALLVFIHYSAVGWKIILDYLVGVKDVFQVEEKKKKKNVPLKTFFPVHVFH